MIRNLPIVAMSILLLSPVGGAEEKISVRTLALRADEMPELFIHTGKEYLPLRFSAVQPGETLKALASNPLPLYRSGADSMDGFAIAHRVKFPQPAAGILLLCWKDGDSPRFVAIKDDYENARYNDWLLINASQHPIAFKAGQTTLPLALKPGVSTTHRVAAAKGVGIEIIAQAQLKGKVRTFYSTFWPAHPDKRSVVVFVDDESRILVKRFSDSLAVPDTGNKVN